MKMTEKLDLLMREKGITRGELAKSAAIPYTTIVGYYERGYQNAKLTNLWQLAHFFDCSLDYLVDDDLGYDTIKNEPGIKKAPTESGEGKYQDIIELLDKLPENQIPEIKGYLKHLIYENEAVEAAKQISNAV